MSDENNLEALGLGKFKEVKDLAAGYKDLEKEVNSRVKRPGEDINEEYIQATKDFFGVTKESKSAIQNEELSTVSNKAIQLLGVDPKVVDGIVAATAATFKGTEKVEEPTNSKANVLAQMAQLAISAEDVKEVLQDENKINEFVSRVNKGDVGINELKLMKQVAGGSTGIVEADGVVPRSGHKPSMKLDAAQKIIDKHMKQDGPFKDHLHPGYAEAKKEFDAAMAVFQQSGGSIS